MDGKIDREEFVRENPSISFSAKSFQIAERMDSNNEKRPKVKA